MWRSLTVSDSPRLEVKIPLPHRSAFGETQPVWIHLSFTLFFLYLFLSLSLPMLSSLPACSINGFSCIIWVGVLELMDWGGWHGFQSYSFCPVPFCKNSSFLASAQPPPPSFLLSLFQHHLVEASPPQNSVSLLRQIQHLSIVSSKWKWAVELHPCRIVFYKYEYIRYHFQETEV